MDIIQKVFKDDGSIPNSHLKVLIYKSAFEHEQARQPESYEQVNDRGSTKTLPPSRYRIATLFSGVWAAWLKTGFKIKK